MLVSIVARGLLTDTVIVSDEAGQFDGTWSVSPAVRGHGGLSWATLGRSAG